MGAPVGFTKKDARVRTKRSWLFVATTLATVLGFGPACFAATSLVDRFHYSAVFVLLAYVSALIGGLQAWKRWWRELRGELRADESELRIGGEVVARRADVRHGYVLRRGDRIFVRLGRMLRPIDIEVADEAEAETLLAAMRLDAAHSVAQYPMTHGTWTGSLLRAVAGVMPLVLVPPLCLALGIPIPIFLGLLFAACIGTVGYSFNQMLRVSVGADGVRIRHLLQRARFVPFSAIEEAVTDGRDIELRLAGGEEIVMHHPAGRGMTPVLFADRADEARKLVERITSQVEAHRASTAADPAVFARSGRETEQWVRDVVGAADVNASYRTPAVPPDELWRIVEDAAAPATARAGAAVALRGALDEEGRERLRATADACAAPRLRVALETVASGDGDEEELRDALEVLEDQPAVRRARLV